MASRIPPLAGSKNDPPIVAITIVMITADQFACSRVRANEAMAIPVAAANAANTEITTSIPPLVGRAERSERSPTKRGQYERLKEAPDHTRKKFARKDAIQA